MKWDKNNKVSEEEEVRNNSFIIFCSQKGLIVHM